MTEKRMKELLNNVIDNISASENTQETIKRLLYLGFTGEELCMEFSFGEDDVRHAKQDMDEYEFDV